MKTKRAVPLGKSNRGGRCTDFVLFPKCLDSLGEGCLQLFPLGACWWLQAPLLLCMRLCGHWCIGAAAAWGKAELLPLCHDAKGKGGKWVDVAHRNQKAGTIVNKKVVKIVNKKATCQEHKTQREFSL